MWYVIVPLIIVVGIGVTYALVAPLRRYLSRPLPASPSPTTSSVPPSPSPTDEGGLTPEMIDEWIRECRSDDT